jgi:hypothetical protein
MEPEIISKTKAGNLREVQRLIKDGVDLNQRESEDSHTALIHACGLGHLDIVEALIAAGALLNISTKTVRTTALNCACRNNHLDIARLLIKAGADPTPTTYGGSKDTLLMVAAVGGDVKLLAYLLSQPLIKATLDQQNAHGYTVLIYALIYAPFEVVELFYYAGADTLIRDFSGKNAADYARDKRAHEPRLGHLFSLSPWKSERADWVAGAIAVSNEEATVPPSGVSPSLTKLLADRQRLTIPSSADPVAPPRRLRSEYASMIGLFLSNKATLDDKVADYKSPHP